MATKAELIDQLSYAEQSIASLRKRATSAESERDNLKRQLRYLERDYVAVCDALEAAGGSVHSAGSAICEIAQALRNRGR